MIEKITAMGKGGVENEEETLYNSIGMLIMPGDLYASFARSFQQHTG